MTFPVCTLQCPVAGPVASRSVPFVTLAVTHGPHEGGRSTGRADSGEISTRRDGRVVDGGGLENHADRLYQAVIFWRVDRVQDPQNPATIRAIMALPEYYLITDRRFSREVGVVASRVVPLRPDRYTGGYTRTP